MSWIKLSGILRYEPYRGPEFKKQYKTRTLIIDIGNRGNELDLYYQWFLKKKFGSFLEMQRPLFGTHVTVVGGTEYIPNLSAWKKYEREQVEFEYSPELNLTYQFWSLPVRCHRARQIRDELGLKQKINLHITIGRLHNWQL